MLQPMTIDKEKQKEGTIQDEEVLLYKLYNISLSNSSETSSLDTQMIQNKINNLEKALKILQLSVKTIPFTPPSHYKTIQVNGEKKRTYWNNIVYQFLQQKHNADTSC